MHYQCNIIGNDIYAKTTTRNKGKGKEETSCKRRTFGQQRRRKTETEKRRKYLEIENVLSGEEIENREGKGEKYVTREST